MLDEINRKIFIIDVDESSIGFYWGDLFGTIAGLGLIIKNKFKVVKVRAIFICDVAHNYEV